MTRARRWAWIGSVVLLVAAAVGILVATQRGPVPYQFWIWSHSRLDARSAPGGEPLAGWAVGWTPNDFDLEVAPSRSVVQETLARLGLSGADSSTFLARVVGKPAADGWQRCVAWSVEWPDGAVTDPALAGRWQCAWPGVPQSGECRLEADGTASGWVASLDESSVRRPEFWGRVGDVIFIGTRNPTVPQVFFAGVLDPGSTLFRGPHCAARRLE